MIVILSVQAEVAAEKQCPTLEPVSNFNSSSFFGRWYEIKRSKSMLDKYVESCTSIEFTTISDDNITMDLTSVVGQKAVTIKGSVTIVTNGSFDFKFSVKGCKFVKSYKLNIS